MKSFAKTVSIYLMLVLVLGLFLPVSSQATISLLTGRNLSATDHIDWGVLGPAGTTVSNPFTINTTVDHLTVQVSQPGGAANTFQRRDQIPPNVAAYWDGNFAPGDNLIFNASNNPIDLVFPNFLSIFQTQIQSVFFGNFTATIEALDQANHVLASFDVPGISNGNADNSAIVIGLFDSTASMNHIRLSTSIGSSPGFAINTVDTLNGPPVPLPPAVWLLGSGLLGLLGFRRLRA